MNHLSSIARLAISLRMGNIWANEFCPVDVHVSFLDEVPPQLLLRHPSHDFAFILAKSYGKKDLSQT